MGKLLMGGLLVGGMFAGGMGGGPSPAIGMAKMQKKQIMMQQQQRELAQMATTGLEDDEMALQVQPKKDED